MCVCVCVCVPFEYKDYSIEKMRNTGFWNIKIYTKHIKIYLLQKIFQFHLELGYFVFGVD